MKVEEVPQDNGGFLKEGKVRDLCYAVDEEGHYRQVLSVGWDPKNEALRQSWEAVNERVEEIKQEIIKGKVSPIAYFLEKNLMDTTILSSYTGIWRWKVKRHLNPKVFKKLNQSVLQKYAEVFKISVDELVNFS